MASKEADASPESDEDDDERGPLAPWQKAWLARHHVELIRRVPTADVVDRLIQRGAMDTSMDVYQRIRACHEELRNDRARLLLDYVVSSPNKVFWDFQEALKSESCGDLAIRRADVPTLKESCSAVKRPAISPSCDAKRRPRPASVEKVIEKLKSRYRKQKIPSLDGQVPLKAMSLDELRVNISLLSAEKLDALCGCARGGHRQRLPFGMSSLRAKESSVVSLEKLFDADEHGKVPGMMVASGIAGAGKTMAFRKKATSEWAKEDRSPPFWEHISMYFEGSLTDPDWWKAENVAEVFRLSCHDLTESEQDEVVRYICSHAEEVLLVADSMDETEVKTDSYLWSVLTGNCKAVEGLKVIICSRPCEKTSWLARTYLFDQHLEVVGFTEPTIDKFVEEFFSPDIQKARELQHKLESQPDVRSLMHTPLLATMICRRFDDDSCRALPSTQTAVYEEAALAMVRQSAAQDSGAVQHSILAQLSPPALHLAVANLSQLAYNALVKKITVFTSSELKEAGCLGYTAQLGFLSVSPSPNIAGRGQDVYSFPHHTMQEFFASVHAVRQLIGSEQAAPGRLVTELGVDGHLSRFWMFVSGLLEGKQCQLLLSALLSKSLIGNTLREKSRRLLLLIDCYGECDSKLEAERSTALAIHFRNTGLNLSQCHLSASQAQIVCRVFQRHSTELKSAIFHLASMEASSMPPIIASLQQCHNLVEFTMPESAFKPETVDGVVKIIQNNASTLRSLLIPASDDGIPVPPAIINGLSLQGLTIGSHALTNAGSQSVLDVFQRQPGLQLVGLIGKLDDDGFAPIAEELSSMKTLLQLDLMWTQLSPDMLSATLSSLTHLVALGLHGVTIGDAGFRLIAQHLRKILNVDLHNVGLTPLSIPALCTLVCDMPMFGTCEVAVQRSIFKPTKEVIADILETTPLKLALRDSFVSPFAFFGLQIRDHVRLQTQGERTLVLCI